MIEQEAIALELEKLVKGIRDGNTKVRELKIDFTGKGKYLKMTIKSEVLCQDQLKK